MFGMMRAFANFFEQLWFKEEQPLTLGVLRILLGIFLLLHFAVNFSNWERLFAIDGFIPFSAEVLVHPRAIYSIFAYCDHTALWLVYWISIAASILFMLGYWTRLSTLILYIVLDSGKLRIPWMMEGGEHVIIVVLFVLLLAPIGESFSLSTWLKSRTQPELWPGGRPRPVWSLWLLRVLLSIIYGSSIYHKLKETDHWSSGKALYNILLWERHSRLISVDAIHHPVFTAISTYSSVVLELLAPVLIWIPKARPWMALALCGLHLGIMVMLTSATEMFNLLMIFLMVLLIDNDLMLRTWQKLQSIDRKRLSKIFKLRRRVRAK